MDETTFSLAAALDHSDDVDGAMLSGTTAIDVVAPGIDPTKEVDLSAFNAAFEPARTEYDWLSRDPDEVDAYVADHRRPRHMARPRRRALNVGR